MFKSNENSKIPGQITICLGAIMSFSLFYVSIETNYDREGRRPYQSFAVIYVLLV